MVLLCLILVGVAFVISVFLTRVAIAVGRRLGQLDVPDAPGRGRKTHVRTVPNTGGIAIFWTVVLPILGIAAGAWWLPRDAWTGWLAPVGPYVDGLRGQTPLALAVVGGALVVHILGLIDDRKRLGPYLKLIVELTVAAVLAIFFDVRIFEFLGRSYGVPGTAAGIVLSIVWIVVITNAMNFLDNMDGLSAGVGAICAGLYLAATLVGGQWFVAAAAALLTGALLGFLVFNFPPASVFMGDGGALVLGFLLAIISIRTTYFSPGFSVPGGPDVHHPGNWYGVLMPLMVLAVPLYDFSSVTLIRLSRGQSPFVGDQNHFSHRLVRKGLSKRGAVVMVWLCTLATGMGGVMLGSLRGWQAALVAAQAVAVLAVLGMVERTGGNPDSNSTANGK